MLPKLVRRAGRRTLLKLVRSAGKRTLLKLVRSSVQEEHCSKKCRKKNIVQTSQKRRKNTAQSSQKYRKNTARTSQKYRKNTAQTSHKCSTGRTLLKLVRSAQCCVAFLLVAFPLFLLPCTERPKQSNFLICSAHISVY